MASKAFPRVLRRALYSRCLYYWEIHVCLLQEGDVLIEMTMRVSERVGRSDIVKETQ